MADSFRQAFENEIQTFYKGGNSKIWLEEWGIQVFVDEEAGSRLDADWYKGVDQKNR